MHKSVSVKSNHTIWLSYSMLRVSLDVAVVTICFTCSSSGSFITNQATTLTGGLTGSSADFTTTNQATTLKGSSADFTTTNQATTLKDPSTSAQATTGTTAQATTSNSACASYQFRCANGQCVYNNPCSGYSECRDRSDLLKCTCTSDQFQCASGHQCVSSYYRCSPYGSACFDGSDQWNCNCTDDQFKCTGDGGCIPNSYVCNGYNNCINGSDEINCTIVQTQTTWLTTMSTTNHVNSTQPTMSTPATLSSGGPVSTESQPCNSGSSCTNAHQTSTAATFTETMTIIVIILAVLLGLALIGCTVMIVVIVCQRIHASHLTQLHASHLTQISMLNVNEVRVPPGQTPPYQPLVIYNQDEVYMHLGTGPIYDDLEVQTNSGNSRRHTYFPPISEQPEQTPSEHYEQYQRNDIST